MYDNFQQETPEMVHLMRQMGCKPVSYGKDVKRRDAESAVAKFKPEICIASWLTHRYNFQRHHLKGNQNGPRFSQMLEHTGEIVMLGNEGPHSINPLIHDGFYELIDIDPAFLWSRAKDPKLDVLYRFSKDLII